MEGPRPDKFCSRCTECRQCKEKHGFPAGVQKVCKSVQSPRKRKIHEEYYDSSWDFGALEGTRIPGPLIKSQMLYRLSYERIFCSKTILPNNITTIGRKMQECRRKKRKFPHKRPELRRGGGRSGTERLGGSRYALPVSACSCAASAAGALPENRRAVYARRAKKQCGAAALAAALL